MAEEEEQNLFMFKVLIVGPTAVGKTALMLRYFDNQFYPTYNSSVGVDFKEKKITRGDSEVRIQVWDTAGQERYKSITMNYYRGANGFLLVYDVTSNDSFKKIDSWVEEMREKTSDDVAIVLVGNKCDFSEMRLVSMQEGQKKAEKLGVKYMETSTKDNLNVTETFETLLDSMMVKDKEDAERTGIARYPPPDKTVVDMGDTESSAVATQDQYACQKC